MGYNNFGNMPPMNMQINFGHGQIIMPNNMPNNMQNNILPNMMGIRNMNNFGMMDMGDIRPPHTGLIP